MKSGKTEMKKKIKWVKETMGWNFLQKFPRYRLAKRATQTIDTRGVHSTGESGDFKSPEPYQISGFLKIKSPVPVPN